MAYKREPSPLGNLLRELFQRKMWQQRLDQHQLFLAWEDIVGADLAVHAKPHCIRGRVLWLEVTDSVWMQQLHLQKITLLELINGQMEGEKLQDIRFRLETSQAAGPSRPARAIPPGEGEISAGESTLFEELLEPLQDDELKATMRRIWRKGKRYGQ